MTDFLKYFWRLGEELEILIFPKREDVSHNPHKVLLGL